TLGAFLEAPPQPREPTLAQVPHARGQLLAGPRVDVEEALRCYELAVKLDPDFTRAVERLAGLLSYMPERWDEAVRQHASLLRQDPARESSIRSLVKICESRGDDAGGSSGRAILRALGLSTCEEFDAASDRLGFRVARDPRLPDPHGERARKLLVATSSEVAQALASKRSNVGALDTPLRDESQRAFHDAMRAAECELSLPEIDSIPTQYVGEAIRHVAALAWDQTQPDIDRETAEQLDRSIGRWARRKLRKSLEGTNPADLQQLSWDRWRASLRGVAASIALDRRDGNLRNALLALSTDPEDACADPIAETADITDRVRSREPAYELLRQVTQAFCTKIAER
ncbi:MAG: hypothetical protein GY944_26625, partial [bacterium]|nr:hypothetical protein [bacterium]